MKFVVDQLHVPMYNYNITVVLTDNIQEYCLDELGQEMVTCPVANLYDFHDREYPVDFIVIFNPKQAQEDTVSHEAFHLTARIMRYIGCPLIEESEEPYAYLQDYLTRVIKNKLKRINKELQTKLTESNGSKNGSTTKEVQPTASRV